MINGCIFLAKLKIQDIWRLHNYIVNLKKIAIFASGSGTNAEKIIEHFHHSGKGKVAVVASNKKDAFVLERAKQQGIPVFCFSKTELLEGGVKDKMVELGIDLIVLAGFLLKVPETLVDAYPNKIINIHPALLPKFGGKGMYGNFVHEAVKAAGETHTGITIHFVNNHYDEGEVIFQERIEVLPEDSPGEIAQKVHDLEHKYFPKVIESLL